MEAETQMKIDDLLKYVIERGAEVNVQNNRLFIRNPDKLTPLCKQVLYERRAEIYHRFRLPLADAENVPIESCPHCGKPMAIQGDTF